MSSTTRTRPGRSPVDPLVPPGRLDGLRPAARSVRAAYRHVTGRVRVLPDFVVIGAQKSGTTSLFDHLAHHPDVRPSATKEVHYFDREYDRGEQWYRGHFPLAATVARTRARTGEATPAYLAHPPAAARARELVPHARLIAVLRDPVDRAYSHYQHEVAKGFEHLPFEAALRCEPDRLAAEEQATVDAPERGPAVMGHAAAHFSYVRRGRYAEQLERWLAHFPREQLLVLAAEELYADPRAATARALVHIGVTPRDPGQYRRRNARSYAPMDPATRASLQRYFAPYNQRLFELLDTSFDWS